MFEAIFKSELTAVQSNEILIEKLWQEIDFNYNNTNRHYHNLKHLDSLAAELSVIRSLIRDWQTIIFSIAYHDIVYNIRKNDNEEKSGDVAVERLIVLNLPENQRIKCREQILATKLHGLSADSDTNYFTDADLAILGSEDDLYKMYTLQIRKEYKFYPDLLYKPGRRKVLHHFLQMNSIYKTIYFNEKYELQARKNIERELQELG